jgi:hypothetical protein
MTYSTWFNGSINIGDLFLSWGSPFDGSGPVADAVLDGSRKSAYPVVQLLMDELVRPAHNHTPPIDDLLSAVTNRLKKWDETTSVPPFSKRYLTQYISLIRIIREPSKNQDPPPILPPEAQTLAEIAKELLQLHVSLLQLAIQHNQSYARWQRVANLMLEKDFGIPKIHRLRIIHLYEADLNLLLGIYFARVLVRHIESNDGFNDGCYGNRAGLSAHEPVFVEELQNTVCYLSRTNRVLIVPLGSWYYPLRSDSPKWYFYWSYASLVVRSRSTNTITQYPPERR